MEGGGEGGGGGQVIGSLLRVANNGGLELLFVMR